MAAGKPEACSLLLMLCWTGEAARRMLPMTPIVSPVRLPSVPGRICSRGLTWG
ncbi:MAG: hypothetical protein ACLU0O_01480 [Collinsella sp.]